MTAILTDTWQALIRRKLWPLAVLLVVALAAVPFLLKSDPAPVATAPAIATANADVAASVKAVEPVVSTAGASDRRRKVLGAPKNPFTPAPVPKAKQPKAAAATAGSSTAAAGTNAPASGSSGGSSSGGSSSGSGSSGTTTPAPAATPTPKRTFAPDSLTVRFGGDQALERRGLKKLEALPSADEPLLVYLGLEKAGKVAVFLVDSSIRAQGDGACEESSAGTCEKLRMRAGDTEFLDVLGDDGVTVTAAYQLDLLKIHAKPGKASASKAHKAAKARVSISDAASMGRAAISLAGVARLLGSL
jgi:hypothetical protein